MITKEALILGTISNNFSSIGRIIKLDEIKRRCLKTKSNRLS
nr:hypothetical protein [Mycoplasmopsis bovis]